MTTETKTQEANDAMLPAAQEEGGALVAMDFAAALSEQSLSAEEAEDALIEDAGKGIENMPETAGFEPMMKLMQKLSKELEAGEKLIPGAKIGDFVFPETGQVYGDRVVLTPCHFRQAFVLWEPANKGGKYAGELMISGEEYARLNPDPNGNKTFRVTPDGLNVCPTCYYAVLIQNVSGGPVEQGTFRMHKSEVRSAHKWNRIIRSQRLVVKGQEIVPPIYGFTYLVASKLVKGPAGSWYVPDVIRGIPTPAERLGRAREYHKQVRAGLLAIGSDESPEDDSRQAAAGKKADVSKGLSALSSAANNAEEAK